MEWIGFVLLFATRDESDGAGRAPVDVPESGIGGERVIAD